MRRLPTPIFWPVSFEESLQLLVEVLAGVNQVNYHELMRMLRASSFMINSRTSSKTRRLFIFTLGFVDVLAMVLTILGGRWSSSGCVGTLF